LFGEKIRDVLRVFARAKTRWIGKLGADHRRSEHDSPDSRLAFGRIVSHAHVCVDDGLTRAAASVRQGQNPAKRDRREAEPARDCALAVVTDIAADEEFDSGFLLELLKQSVRVTMTEGATTAKNLRIGPS
jgi:hypothetical protein